MNFEERLIAAILALLVSILIAGGFALYNMEVKDSCPNIVLDKP